MIRTILTLLITLSLGTEAVAQICAEWGQSTRVGELGPEIREASGLAVSRRFPNRLYHVNDSGDRGSFYITDGTGRLRQTVVVSGFQPVDVEGLGLGNCGGNRTCLVIGDIGNNEKRRRSVDLIVVEELERFPQSVTPQHRITARYPDGNYDAEGLAIHPDGTLFVLTKEHPARLFRLSKEQWQTRNGQIQTMSLVTTLDVAGLGTSLDISADGRELLVLTYLNAREFEFNSWQGRRIPLAFLQQQEAVAYMPDGRSFLYTTESVGLPAGIMTMVCR
jgi:hypothetical protein